MREILFRAKLKSYNDERDNYFVSGSFQKCLSGKCRIHYLNGGNDVVKEETVGQYINMNDIKGNKIFEGDILENCVGEKGIVEIDEFGIRMELAFNDFEYFSQKDLISYGVKIIGNIYDNEELIKKVRNDEQ